MLNDQLTKAIAEKRAERDELQRRLEFLDVEINALEKAAAWRPIQGDDGPARKQQRTTVDRTGARGRQIGAISSVWRDILRMMHDMYPDGAPESEVREICMANGLDGIRERDVKRRMDALSKNDYVSFDGDVWRVTQTAIDRYNFTSDQNSPIESKVADDCESPAT